MLFDYADPFMVHVNAVQANLYSAMHGDSEANVLKSQMLAAKDLLSQLQSHLSAIEVTLDAMV
jgi:hypothetical protein